MVPNIPHWSAQRRQIPVSQGTDSGLPSRGTSSARDDVARVNPRMLRLQRAEAESLAEELGAAFLLHLGKVVADLPTEQDEDGLSPRDPARIERSALNMRRKLEGLPIDRMRKVG